MVASTMYYDCALLFKRLGLLIALVPALFSASSGHAQSSKAFGVVATTRTKRSSLATSATVSFQPPGLTIGNQGNAQSASSVFAAPSGQPDPALLNPSPGLTLFGGGGTGSGQPPFASAPAFSAAVSSGPASNLSGSPAFIYSVPGETFAIVTQPNEPVITGNDLVSPLVDAMRTGLPADFIGRAPPTGVGSTMDTSGANHFEASVAPYWVFCRNSRYPVTVTLPAQVYVSEDPYYFGHHFGWVAAGVNVRVPLSFIPGRYGKWSAGTSADLCYYGTTTNEFVNSIGIQMPKIGAALNLEL